MKKFETLSLVSLLLAITLTLNSCQAIGDIFKTGVAVGVIIVVVVIIVIFWLIGKAKK